MAGDITAARVRQLIKESGLTQAEFAGRVGLDASKMSKSLSGVRRFTSLDLARIADLCGVTVDWLLGVDSLTPSLATRTAPLSSSADAAIKEAERLARMRADLAFLGYRREVPAFELTGGSLIDQGTDLACKAAEHAARERINFWETRDLADAVEKAFGVDVRIYECPNAFDGLVWSDEHSPLIVVSTSRLSTQRLPTRQRFTIAHALGHLLARDDRRLIVDENIHDREHKSTKQEMLANAFAAELLLPARLLRDEAARTRWTREDFAALACRLWVAPNTLAWRLFNLGLIDRNRCEDFGRLTAWDAASIAGVAGTFGEWLQSASRARMPFMLVRDAFQAYADGKSTLRPLANLLGVDTDLLRQVMHGKKEDSPLASWPITGSPTPLCSATSPP